MEELILQAEESDEGQRVDQFVSARIPDLSRVMVTQLIKDGEITIGGKKTKPSYHLRPGDEVLVILPEPHEVMIEAQDIPLEVVYEDENLLVINKAQGMVVHPAVGNWDGTLVNALMFHIKDLSGINGELRPGIVHRLDKDTSGLLVVAKNDVSHRSLAEQIKDHLVTREYTAVVHGVIGENRGRIEAPIGRDPRDRKKMAVIGNGRDSITSYEVLKRYPNYTLIKVKLETGRTHQIRVHMNYIGHPILGDPLYGTRSNPWGLDKQTLHAGHLEFTHPATDEKVSFNSPLPPYFENVLRMIESVEDGALH